MADNKTNIIDSYKYYYNDKCEYCLDSIIFFRVIDKKLEKLNKNLYFYEDNISLFITTSCYYPDFNMSFAKDVLNYILKTQTHYKLGFNEVFIDCFVDLFRFDIKNKKIKRINLMNFHPTLTVDDFL